MNIVNDCLVLAVDAIPDEDDLKRIQAEMLAKIDNDSVRGVLLDVSRVQVLDSALFALLTETSKMASLLGSKTIFVGFQAGVASSLVDLDAEMENIDTAVTMEDGLEQLRSPRHSTGDDPKMEKNPPAPDPWMARSDETDH